MSSRITLCALSAIAVLLASGLPMRAEPGYPDDGDKASLLQALEHQEVFLSAHPERLVRLGERSVTRRFLFETTEAFRKLVAALYGTPDFERVLSTRFEVLGVVTPGAAHLTGYYLPLLEARRRPDASFRFPLYARPQDPGRLARSEIEDGHALDGQGLEIAWLSDELARYLLMVQGSGMLVFKQGQRCALNFAGGNAHPYVSLGKLLVQDGKIPQARISVPAIKRYFADHPEELHGYLERNPSYVFFKLAPSGPFGVDGIPLTPGRSMATDKRLSPSGAIAYVSCRLPSGRMLCRFFCDQDTGSAIKGPGRADLYWGAGPDAEQMAGTLNATGSISYLLLRPRP